MVSVRLESHPLLDAGVFVTRLARPLGQVSWSADDAGGLAVPTPALRVTDEVRDQVRALLRHGGYKPAGRGKPASEYLVRAHAEGMFPVVNPAVDVCNHVSLHSGLPISVVDLDRGTPPWSIVICPPGTTYVFNQSGQVIDASGLCALTDASGPSGTPVKDAQRTKTGGDTVALISVVWGTRALPGRTETATRWYRALTETIAGARTEDVTIERA